MLTLVGALVTGANAGVEAVEALLLLSEWLSHWCASTTVIGRGEENRSVWMYVGTAVRLGYLLDLDRITPDHEENVEEASLNARRKLAWVGTQGVLFTFDLDLLLTFAKLATCAIVMFPYDLEKASGVEVQDRREVYWQRTFLLCNQTCMDKKITLR